MEYVTYILIILGVMTLCFVVFRDTGLSSAMEDGPNRTVAIPEDPAKQAATNGTSVKTTENLNVPIPWGWPGHDESTLINSRGAMNTQEVHGVSESLHRFADRLLSAKQTVEDREYLLKKDASLRALIEDRYGRTYRAPEGDDTKAAASSMVKMNEPVDLESLRELKTPWGW